MTFLLSLLLVLLALGIGIPLWILFWAGLLRLCSSMVGGPVPGWGLASGVKPGTIMMLSDKNAALCRGLGVASESDVFVRSERYALIAKDGVIRAWLPAESPSGEKNSDNTYCPMVLENVQDAIAAL